MKRFHCLIVLVVMLAAALSLNLLSGCATDSERQTEARPKQNREILNDRLYYESLSPLERQELDRRMKEEEWQERKR